MPGRKPYRLHKELAQFTCSRCGVDLYATRAVVASKFARSTSTIDCPFCAQMGKRAPMIRKELSGWERKPTPDKQFRDGQGRCVHCRCGMGHSPDCVAAWAARGGTHAQ